MITTREFFEHDAEDIINNIESIYSVQRKKQINIFLRDVYKRQRIDCHNHAYQRAKCKVFVCCF